MANDFKRYQKLDLPTLQQEMTDLKVEIAEIKKSKNKIDYQNEKKPLGEILKKLFELKIKKIMQAVEKLKSKDFDDTSAKSTEGKSEAYKSFVGFLESLGLRKKFLKMTFEFLKARGESGVRKFLKVFNCGGGDCLSQHMAAKVF